MENKRNDKDPGFAPQPGSCNPFYKLYIARGEAPGINKEALSGRTVSTLKVTLGRQDNNNNNNDNDEDDDDDNNDKFKKLIKTLRTFFRLLRRP
jgi:hypothetical protein